MLGRCPLYLSHGPAAEMVSVVHCPFTFTSTRRPESSLLGKGGKGSRRARRVEAGSIFTSTEGSGTPGVGRSSGLPSAKPAVGRSEPLGGEKRKEVPEGVGMVSVSGLKVVLPAYVRAVTSSGDARKFIVAGFPSLRPRKLRL